MNTQQNPIATRPNANIAGSHTMRFIDFPPRIPGGAILFSVHETFLVVVASRAKGVSLLFFFCGPAS
jgi:hypothetical protein